MNSTPVDSRAVATPARPPDALASCLEAWSDTVDAPASPQRVLVPVKFSPDSLRTLHYAANLARHWGCHVTWLHVVHLNIVGEERGVPRARLLEEMATVASQALHRAAARCHPPPDRILVRRGDPVPVILHTLAELKADVLLMGRPGPRGLSRLLGPAVSRKIIERAPCPILLVARSGPNRAR